MKYFTTEWWEGGCEAPSNVIEQYRAYLASILVQLPTSLVDFENNHTLHDSQLKSIDNNFSNRTIVMMFDGWTQNLEHRVRYKLNFFGVSQFHQQLPEQDYVESELGDVGYVELELVDAAIEMRILFASSAEFKVTFSDFAFEYR